MKSIRQLIKDIENDVATPPVFILFYMMKNDDGFAIHNKFTYKRDIASTAYYLVRLKGFRCILYEHSEYGHCRLDKLDRILK